MNKIQENLLSDQPTSTTTRTKESPVQKTWITIACLCIFPLIYLIGRILVGF